jgi:group I intron endonuclease
MADIKATTHHGRQAILDEPAPASSGIYAIVNSVDGKCYYGRTNNLDVRRRSHWSCLRNGKHKNPHLQRAWDTCGESAFTFVVVELAEVSELIDLEQRYLDENADGYNICDTAGGRGRLGLKATAATRRRMSAAVRRRPPPGKKTRELWSRQRKGRRPSAEVRAKLSEGLRRRWKTRQVGPVCLKCSNCGVEFVVPFGQRKRVETCSRECAGGLISKTKQSSDKWRRLTHDGKTMTVLEWSKALGIPHQTIHCRLWKGWSVSDALSVAYEKRHGNRSPQLLSHGGKTQSILSWAVEVGMSYQAIRQRLKLGWSVEDALTAPLNSLKKRDAHAVNG